MISSYQFSQRFDAISVMAGATVALFSFLRTLTIVSVSYTHLTLPTSDLV